MVAGLIASERQTRQNGASLTLPPSKRIFRSRWIIRAIGAIHGLRSHGYAFSACPGPATADARDDMSI